MSSTGQQGTRPVAIGSLPVGTGPAVVLRGASAAATPSAAPERSASRPASGAVAGQDGPAREPDGKHADGVWLRPPAGRAAAELTRVRAWWDGPLLAEPATPDDLPALAAHADALVLGPAWAGDPALVTVAGALALPVVLARGAAALEDWLRAAGAFAAAGAPGVVLCEDGALRASSGPSGVAGPDLGLARAARTRSGLPVLVAPGDDPHLAAATVAAGADGLWLAPEAGPDDLTAAREAVTLVGALIREEAPGSVDDARQAIDRVDAALAVLLERRARLAGTVQRLKPVGGFAGRDMERERRLVAAMARRAPLLGEHRLAPIMNAVIEAGLHLAEETRRDTRDNGGKPASHGAEKASHQGGHRSRTAMEALAAPAPDHD
ncbi:hypothetical protein Sme01_62240 [Sphaerisporangium melleum]|uniref:Chorismate mutase domain-containing protein n=1 Tax=Sphaerisporangium melleum TaxID=321316 RepID=A0A917RAK6_9ACTN|nr:chorismate mutase [Sphaerisporangium melleum]GGK98498.1 hypothetical protein GCM10007964_45860 [Sphaerisporangium melleum]GII73748.1 hypothetical protein Sme01_62240 [Sphaerisporangium melleum]